MNILSQFPGGHIILQDSIQRSGTSYNKKMMNGKCRINGRGYLRWCFIADAWKYILLIQNVYRDLIFSTKEADVAHDNVEGIRRVGQISDLLSTTHQLSKAERIIQSTGCI